MKNHKTTLKNHGNQQNHENLQHLHHQQDHQTTLYQHLDLDFPTHLRNHLVLVTTFDLNYSEIAKHINIAKFAFCYKFKYFSKELLCIINLLNLCISAFYKSKRCSVLFFIIF